VTGVLRPQPLGGQLERGPPVTTGRQVDIEPDLEQQQHEADFPDLRQEHRHTFIQHRPHQRAGQQVDRVGQGRPADAGTQVGHCEQQQDQHNNQFDRRHGPIRPAKRRPTQDYRSSNCDNAVMTASGRTSSAGIIRALIAGEQRGPEAGGLGRRHILARAVAHHQRLGRRNAPGGQAARGGAVEFHRWLGPALLERPQAQVRREPQFRERIAGQRFQGQRRIELRVGDHAHHAPLGQGARHRGKTRHGPDGIGRQLIRHGCALDLRLRHAGSAPQGADLHLGPIHAALSRRRMLLRDQGGERRGRPDIARRADQQRAIHVEQHRAHRRAGEGA
jgi:hypothetical protein